MNNIKPIRLKHYDYKENGYYFVTISTNYKSNSLVGETKNVIARFIEQLSKKIEGVTIDYYVIMPDHIHLILILNSCKLKLGEITRRLNPDFALEIRF
jgi:putative transposase